MKPASYIAAARRIAQLAARVEATADAQTPRQKAARTQAIHSIVRHARLLSGKNRAGTDVQAPGVSRLPAVGQALRGGLFCGVTTAADGTTQAVVLMPGTPDPMPWADAMDWAQSQGAQLPSRKLASLLVVTVPQQFEHFLYWTSEPSGAVTAWAQSFYNGDQSDGLMTTPLRARAVKVIPVLSGRSELP